MAVLPGITSQYAKAVYRDHTRTLNSVPNTATNPYIPAVMQYAADNYYIEEINGAFVAGTITQQQMDDTLLLKDANDPQNAPMLLTQEAE